MGDEAVRTGILHQSGYSMWELLKLFKTNRTSGPAIHTATMRVLRSWRGAAADARQAGVPLASQAPGHAWGWGWHAMFVFAVERPASAHCDPIHLLLCVF